MIELEVKGYMCCNTCGIKGVKLWRQYQCSNPWIFCVDCALGRRELNEPPIEVRQDGMYYSEVFEDWSDQVDGLVPCIPTADSNKDFVVYWGYTAVPDDMIRWWKELPLRLEA